MKTKVQNSQQSTSEAAVRDSVACNLEQPAVGAHLLVAIDHQMARIYRARLKGSVSKQVIPGDPVGFGRNSRSVQGHSIEQRNAHRKGFYDAVADSLLGAETILVLGGGTTASRVMRQLLIELGLHHREVANRIVGAIVVNRHLTEKQLFARARGLHAKPF